MQDGKTAGDGPDARPHAEGEAVSTQAHSVEVVARPRTAASLELNGIPSVESLLVTSPARLSGATVRIRIDGVDATAWQGAVEPLSDGGTVEVDAGSFLLPVPLLRRSNEREPVDLVATLVDQSGRELAHSRTRLVILPSSHWVGIATNAPSLAAFATPNASAVHELVRDAATRLGAKTGSPALDGYLSASPERAQRIAEACYDALAARGIAYKVMEASFEEDGQKVRTAADLVADRLGNCLDLSVTLAAMLEACGLAPVVVAGDGHAVVAFSTVEGSFAEPVHDGPSRVVNRVELGEMRVIEATAACSAGGDFGAALAAGEAWVRRATDGVRVIDISAARRAGYHPLPEILEAASATAASAAGGHDPARTRRWEVKLPPNLAPLPQRRLSPQEARLEKWKKKLLDLTLRNKLLNDRAAAGIPLAIHGVGEVALLENLLWEESALSLKPLDGMRGMAPEAMRSELSRGWLRTRLESAELFKRATKAYRESISSIEETGARCLYVAVGALEYRVDGRPEPVVAPLLLVPVAMRRISRAEGFAIRAAAEETVANVALIEAMRLAHGLDIGLSGILGEDDAGIDVPALLDRVRQQVRDVPGAVVHATAKLGTYSFKKLPLFEELRERGPSVVAHPVVRSFLDRRATAEVAAVRLASPESTEHDAPFASMRLPLAADSSQISAVASAAAGATFVLQGPPGTGKSQTITNLLAECLARGKRVLFIAEKAAALEVVSERLDRCGLGGFALDLHADHATKPEFVAQVKAALADLATPPSPGARVFASVGASLDRTRARLRGACGALHDAHDAARVPAHETTHEPARGSTLASVHGGGALSVFRAVERRFASIEGEPHARAAGLENALDAALPERATDGDVEFRREAVAALGAAAAALPAGAAAALADFAPLSSVSHESAQALARDARAMATLAGACAAAIAELAAALGVLPPANLGEMRRLAAFAQSVLPLAASGHAHADRLAEAACAADHSARLARLAQAISLAEKARAKAVELDARFDRGALALPHATLAGDLRAVREKFVLFRWLAVRRVRGELARHAKSALPTDLAQVLALVEAIAATDAALKAVAPHAAELALLGDSPDAPLDLAAARESVQRAHSLATLVRASHPRELAGIGASLPHALRTGTLPASVARAVDSLASLDAAATALTHAASPVPALLADDATPARVGERLARLAANAAQLPAWSAVTVARQRAGELGLEPAANALVEGRLAPAHAESACETEMLAGWIRGRMRTDAALADCASDRMDPLRQLFASNMQEYARGVGASVAASTRARIASELAAAPGDRALSGAMQVLDELRALTTIRRSIRRVMRDSAPAMAVLKPIVLASPLSAATMLPPEFPPFDLVVFDEASQVPVWDAACALSRAKAAVIVGDSRQLPPTNFFDRKEGAAESPGDAPSGAGSRGEGDASAAEAMLGDALEPLDSLLDEAIASGIAEKSLLWHYRSRDERLIEFSNRRSYEGRLQTFPASARAHANLGVEFRPVKGVYDRGGKATNRVEAEAVVDEIRRRLLDADACTANRSIGVVTFSEAQQTLVQDLLDEAIDADATLRERMAEAAGAGEEVFVKNLENVQGDERATMIFSICYGRDASGTVYHNFGPLNLSGGERRLNVAVTRAREKIIVVSSIRASDLDPSKLNALGARDLRDYLAYAELGTVPAARGIAGAAHAPDPSVLEERLAAALTARGWKVDLHVGRSRDYRIGLALADAGAPDRWVLGVELDGAFHRAAPTVVDREIVRAGVLKGLGWKTMRVSCLDLLRDFDATVARVEAAAKG